MPEVREITRFNLCRVEKCKGGFSSDKVYPWTNNYMQLIYENLDEEVRVLVS
jgi:hypothetical protein